MKSAFPRIYTVLAVAIVSICMMTTPVFAALPVTGDERGQKMGIVIGVLVVSVVLIVIFALTGKKKKK